MEMEPLREKPTNLPEMEPLWEKPADIPGQASFRVFVSHSHKDNDFCARLADDLRAHLGDEVVYAHFGFYTRRAGRVISSCTGSGELCFNTIWGDRRATTLEKKPVAA